MNPNMDKQPLMNQQVIQAQTLVNGLGNGLFYTATLSAFDDHSLTAPLPLLQNCNMDPATWNLAMKRIHAEWSRHQMTIILLSVVWILFFGVIIYMFTTLLLNEFPVVTALIIYFVAIFVWMFTFIGGMVQFKKSRRSRTSNQINIENAQVFQPRGFWLQLDTPSACGGNKYAKTSINIYRCNPTNPPVTPVPPIGGVTPV
mmetsp:Transcript_8398/g.14513  ORF Transcript_8398/g.14513 Transcript_8398/m.14513 type:complete len:201 (+) Transcript_8398:89-691(+)